LHISFGIATTIIIQLGTTKKNVKKIVYQIINFFGKNRFFFLPLHGKLLNILMTPKPIQLGKTRKLQALTKLFVLSLKTP